MWQQSSLLNQEKSCEQLSYESFSKQVQQQEKYKLPNDENC